MSEFYSGMPGPAAIDKLNNLWNLAGDVSQASINAAAAAASAAGQATAAAGQAAAASTAATGANNSATASAGQATTASAAQTTATVKASEALAQATSASASESQAASSAQSALDYKNLAADWAEKATEVEPGRFSAKYWAIQAAASVTGQLIYRGTWSAVGGTYPTAPILGDYYKISVAGTISGIVFAVNDSIIYNGTSWDKVDNTEEADLVTSVAGKQGVVTLEKADVGLGNVDNTRDMDKPVSAAVAAALAAIDPIVYAIALG